MVCGCYSVQRTGGQASASRARRCLVAQGEGRGRWPGTHGKRLGQQVVWPVGAVVEGKLAPLGRLAGYGRDDWRHLRGGMGVGREGVGQEEGRRTRWPAVLDQSRRQSEMLARAVAASEFNHSQFTVGIRARLMLDCDRPRARQWRDRQQLCPGRAVPDPTTTTLPSSSNPPSHTPQHPKPQAAMVSPVVQDRLCPSAHPTLTRLADGTRDGMARRVKLCPSQVRLPAPRRLRPSLAGLPPVPVRARH